MPASDGAEGGVGRFDAMLERIRSNDPSVLTVPDRADEHNSSGPPWAHSDNTSVASNDQLEQLAAALHGNTHCLTVHVDIITPLSSNQEEDDRVAELLLDAMEHCAVQVVSFGEDVGISDAMRAAFLDAACTSRFLRAVREDDTVLPALTDSTIPWGMMHPSAEHIRLLAEALVQNTHFESLHIEAHDELRQRDFDPLLLAIPQCTLDCVAIWGELQSAAEDQAVRAKLATALLPNLLQGRLDEDSPTGDTVRYLDFEESHIRNEHVGLIGDAVVGDSTIKRILGLRVGFHSETSITPEAVEVLMKSVGDPASSVYSVQVSDDSSMFFQLHTTDDEHAREIKMRATIQAVCVPRALAMIASDDACIRKLIVDDTWSAQFNDDDAEKLATALETNTTLETLIVTPEVASTLTDEGVAHLERVISSAPSCAVSEVQFCGSDGESDSSSVMQISGAKRSAIERRCLENGMRRLKANDPEQTVLTCTGRTDFHQFEELASVLLRNAEKYQAVQPLRINFRGNKHMTDANARMLMKALTHPNACHVQSLQLEGTSLSNEKETALYRQMSLNLQRHEQRSDSIEDHRPIQRLLLSAICSNAACFNQDVLSLVVEKLEQSSVCPFMHADGSGAF